MYTLVLLLVFFGFFGCAGEGGVGKSSLSKAFGNMKAGPSELKGDDAYQEKNYAAAFGAYQKAAESGGRYGQFMLANMYLAGKGVKRDPEEYLHWMKQSADNGYPPANYLMGMIYLSSNAVTAAKYFEIAAREEHGAAMHILGLMHARGVGVPQSDKEALRWFRMAKAQGFPVDEQLLSESTIQTYLKKNQPKTTPNVVTQPQAKTSEQPWQTPPPQPQLQVKGVETPHAAIRDKKALIREIQKHLTEQGYKPGPIDGIMGGKTLQAIKDFQRKRGMEPDGLATEKVLDALKP
jgi:localization factor PodJL